ncbi:MAG TPA: alpha/beta hydrolase [Solirubrobacter sp.]|jgi:pimeloyl-ACP methyl ester carboxylesterase|nr:alpha/beta hydrolase [Solirubrobacter sp.]
MDLRIDADGVTLSGEEAGEGPAVVLLHGLTATRRYVVMGSRALERSRHRVIAYDARAHGKSDPGDDYGYQRLSDDLLAVLDDREIERAVLAGASMGAHTLTKFALDHPERVAGLAILTPAYDPDAPRDFDRWDALAKGLREGGVEGFVEAYGTPKVPEKWHETINRVLHQRLGAHEHPEALADALEEVPRSRPFEAWEDLGAIEAPTVVVASRDEVDPEHPYAVGERYAEAIAGARLVSEDEGASPLAWQGAQVSKVIAGVADGQRHG